MGCFKFDGQFLWIKFRSIHSICSFFFVFPKWPKINNTTDHNNNNNNNNNNRSCYLYNIHLQKFLLKKLSSRISSRCCTLNVLPARRLVMRVANCDANDNASTPKSNSCCIPLTVCTVFADSAKSNKSNSLFSGTSPACNGLQKKHKKVQKKLSSLLPYCMLLRENPLKTHLSLLAGLQKAPFTGTIISY